MEIKGPFKVLNQEADTTLLLSPIRFYV